MDSFAEGTPEGIMREEEREGLLTVCYDTKNRYISKEEFVVGVDAVNEILQEFCEVFFDNKISIETRILVPEHGSFIQNIGFFVMGALLTAPIGEFSTGFMTELLGKSPQEYGKKYAKLACDFTRGLLSTEREKLDLIIPNNVNIDKSIKVKSDFYSCMLKNEEIHGVKFSKDETIIKRDNFILYISSDIVRQLDSVFSYKELKIFKAILFDNNRAHWGFIDVKTGEKITAKICDAVFITKFLSGLLPLKKTSHPDFIKCKLEVEREMVNGKIVERGKKIIEIYTCNDVILKKVPDDFEIGIALSKKNNYQQAGLLEIIRNSKA